MTVSKNVLTVCLTAIFLGVMGAYVFLAYSHIDTSALLGSAIALLGVLGLGMHQSAAMAPIKETVAKIDSQTNGVLTQRIKDGATAALQEYAITNGLAVSGLPSTTAPAAVAPSPAPDATTPAVN